MNTTNLKPVIALCIGFAITASFATLAHGQNQLPKQTHERFWCDNTSPLLAFDDKPTESPNHYSKHKPGMENGYRQFHQQLIFTDEDIEQMMELLQSIKPHFAESLEVLQEQNVEQFREALKRIAPRLKHLLEIKEENPELYELNIKDRQMKYRAYELANELKVARKAADDEKTRQIKAELTTLVTQHFQVRQQLLETEVQQLEKRVQQMREELDQREKNSKELIEAHLNKLAGESQLPKW